jgi:hypothetical protein
VAARTKDELLDDSGEREGRERLATQTLLDPCGDRSQ